MGETSRKGNFVCCLIVVIFMGLGGTYRLGEILNSSNGGGEGRGVGQKEFRPFFIGGVGPSRYQVKLSICQLEEG